MAPVAEVFHGACGERSAVCMEITCMRRNSGLGTTRVSASQPTQSFMVANLDG